MNFLAHLALAAPNDASRIGNLLGDFSKGTESVLRTQLPDPLVDAIMMHRAIDRFTDNHPNFKQARQLLSPEQRRFAGISVDIIYDHFLSRHWNVFYQSSLPLFIEECYQCIERHPSWHAKKFKEVYPVMRREDWLNCYASIEGIDLTFHRVSTRSHRIKAIAGSTGDLQRHYSEFESLFLKFYPELMDYAQSLHPRS